MRSDGVPVVDALADLLSSHRVIRGPDRRTAPGGRRSKTPPASATPWESSLPPGCPTCSYNPSTTLWPTWSAVMPGPTDRSPPKPSLTPSVCRWESPRTPCGASRPPDELARGVFRSGAEREWIDLEVLRRLKRRSLAVLRQQIEPVEGSALGRFAPEWQRATGQPARGRAALGEAIRRLQGVDLAASVLERDVLPLRVADHGPPSRSADARRRGGVGRPWTPRRQGRKGRPVPAVTTRALWTPPAVESSRELGP